MDIISIVRVQFALLFLATAATGANAVDGKKKLDPGKAPGTFHYVYRGTVTFRLKPAYPTVVSIMNPVTGTVAKATVRDAKPFTIEVDLEPGTYTVSSEPTEAAAKAAYFTVHGEQLDIDTGGTLSYPLGPIDNLLHVGKMRDMSPADSQVADAEAPVLKWPTVPGAKSYRGDYRAGGRWENFVNIETHYDLPKLKPGQKVEWEVWAQDADDKTIASELAWFYVKGTDPRVAGRPLQGNGYLGITPLPSFTSKGANVVGRLLTHNESMPCIQVGAVMPGSPALKAGLRPGDFILAVGTSPSPQRSKTASSWATRRPSVTGSWN
jgi:hypothetical protein